MTTGPVHRHDLTAAEILGYIDDDVILPLDHFRPEPFAYVVVRSPEGTLVTATASLRRAVEYVVKHRVDDDLFIPLGDIPEDDVSVGSRR